MPCTLFESPCQALRKNKAAKTTSNFNTKSYLCCFITYSAITGNKQNTVQVFLKSNAFLSEAFKV